MFKFNFSVDDEEIVSSPSFDDPTVRIPDKTQTREAKKHDYPMKTENCSPAISGEVVIPIGCVSIKKLCFSPILYAAQTDTEDQGPSKFAEQINQTDLATGEYEGGFKLWECGMDLTEYLHEIGSEDSYFHDKSVIELGCGHSIPALYCLLRGSPEIAFQDYNFEVLEQLTSPAIEENVKALNGSVPKIDLFSGDWSLLRDVLEPQKYDIILSSDTLYCPANHKPLLELIKFLLKPNGVAYIASKVYYFGVGGGIEDFTAVLNETDPGNQSLLSSVVKTFDDGKSNIRQIIKLQKNEQ